MNFRDDNTRIPSPESRVPGCGDEINLFEYWHVIMKYKKMIAGIVIAASIAAVIISLLLPKTYKAEAVIIPISSNGGGGLSALTGDLGGLAKLAGIKLPGGSVGDSDKILAILKSRTIAENLINRENLMPILFEDKWDAKKGTWKSNNPEKKPTMEAAVRALKGSIGITYEKKEKTISITGESKTPELTARLVNAYIDELQIFINANALTTAKRNRLFIEEQLAHNKQELLEAGKEVNAFYKSKKVSSTEADVDVNVGVVHDEGSFQFENTRLAALDNGNDAAMRNLIAEKTQVENKMAEVQTVKDVPQQVYLTYLMLRRELLAKVNVLLSTQYEMAKIEESKEDLSFQVIDWAVPPVMRASPRRAHICVMSFMAALFGAIFLAFFREYIEKMRKVHKG
jgi:uncharacterized protein involved in exopolysaccharide biosynthesis